jgi:heptosyltransferase-3
MRRFMYSRKRSETDLRGERIDKILLVRANFRLGNSILALPAIQLFRNNYPNARIDFVGSPVSQALCANLPIDRHYQVTRRFPGSSWFYPALLIELRRQNYDLAVELSCSQSALGGFVVGLSGARCKVGREGHWDFWYDMKIAKPAEPNKYRLLPDFVAAIGLRADEVLPRIVLSPEEIAAAADAVRVMGFGGRAPIVGVFVGARKRYGKRWPENNFVRLIQSLTAHGARVIAFVGPEERQLIAYFENNLRPHTPVIYEPSLRKFAALVSRCDLFVTCDSGPMHLACALGIRTVALFLKSDVRQWGPPSASARILHGAENLSLEKVEAACLAELSLLGASRRPEPSPSLSHN